MKKVFTVLFIFSLLFVVQLSYEHKHFSFESPLDIRCSICINISAFAPFTFQVFALFLILAYLCLISFSLPILIKLSPKKALQIRGPPLKPIFYS